MIWLYRRFSQKLAESCVGIVPVRIGVLQKPSKQPFFRLVFIQTIVFVYLEASSTKRRTPGLIASEPVLDCVCGSQGAGV
jgi:hypothetical protein